jgi:hypothetical protein
MKLSQAIQATDVCLDCHLPVMLWGPAGVGKSEGVAALAKQRKVELRDVRLANLDPTDIKGFPAPDMAKKVMTWLPADFLPKAGKGILFFDELNLADKMVQASCYQLMLTHEVGNYKLPPGWDIIAAGNTEKDRANVTRMAGPLANRMVHLTVEADLEEWIAYARAVGVDPRIIAFQRFKKGLALHVFDARAKEPAFPSPRTWVYLDRLLQAATKKGTPISVVDDLISGTVGPAVSIELRAFFDHMVGLPTAQEIFSSPDRAPVPDKLSAKYAVMSMLDKQVDEKTFPAAYKYIKRLNTPEITVLFGRDASNHDSRIKLLPEFRDFAMEHRDLVLG